MDRVLVGALIEIARMGLLTYLSAVRQAQMSDAEKRLLWEQVEQEFYAKLNEPLPEVPE